MRDNLTSIMRDTLIAEMNVTPTLTFFDAVGDDLDAMEMASQAMDEAFKLSARDEADAALLAVRIERLVGEMFDPAAEEFPFLDRFSGKVAAAKVFLLGFRYIYGLVPSNLLINLTEEEATLYVLPHVRSLNTPRVAEPEI